MSRIYGYDELLRLTESLLRDVCAYSPEEAAVTARLLVEADARGIPSHGVSRLDFYQANLRGGFARPGAQPEVVRETPCSLVIDGRAGVGPYISAFAVEKMLGKAQNAGAAFCAVRNSNHFGIAGYWAEEAARHDMIGMAFTNTRSCGIATFGRERALGTNPIAVAIPEGPVPGDGSGLFLLDIATTTVAHGKVEVYDRRKKPMPEGWAVDEQGRGTTDASAFEALFQSNPLFGGHLFLGGEGEQSGGHKGYGLGLLVELLCAGLSQGAASFATFQKGKSSGICHFFACCRLDLFGDSSAIKAHIHAILQKIRDGEKAAGQGRIFIHGEKEAESRARALRDGIEIDDATCALLDRLGAEK